MYQRKQLIATGIIILLSSLAQAQGQIESWTEEDGVLGLGYPVPIPVDTPLPFDGFRAYNGLHTRHQDLMATTDIVHGTIVGTTHNNRDIWAYRVGDADLLTRDGLPEPATMVNGGIHAREWQTPEVVTGIMELFAGRQGNNDFYDYLLDNVNMVLLPVQNVDGFVQTQRFPSQNWLRTDPSDIQNDPNPSPRDGRMRRKNMPGVDEVLTTRDDHLFGIDLNRNNPPFWSANPNRSSSDPESIVYHGTAPHSEPEALALAAAAALGPMSRLRAFTDVHSFSQVFYSQNTPNPRLTAITASILTTMANHNLALPGGTQYLFNPNPNNLNAGFGMTNEWITMELGIPSWGVEVEPSQGPPNFPNKPGCGADYGGFARNCHDGFILPESQIRRVREELAQSFSAVYYQQAGPPSIQALRFLDAETGAVVFEAEWDVTDEQSRVLYSKQLQALQLNHSYDAWLSFNKPMRWRADGVVVPFPGQPANTLDVDADLVVGNLSLEVALEEVAWLNQPGDAPDGYMNYQDDTLKITLSFPDNTLNRSIIGANTETTLKLSTTDMTGMRTDANPATVADWENGAWGRYEDSSGNESDFGGFDTNIKFSMTSEVVPPPFLLEAGITSSWFDPSHDGEGFLLEMLANNVAVLYWFTYDEEGAQDWYVAVGEVRGNRIVFPDLLQASGGEFGPGFDPSKITHEAVGSASFIWSGCDQGEMSYHIGNRHGRMQLSRITRLMGIDCGNVQLPPEREEGLLSGSWYDPSHDGEGYNIEVLITGQVVIYWFSYDPQGQRRWFFGVGEIRDGKLVFDDMLTSSGGIFGPDFDPETVEFKSWGSLELELDCNGGTATYTSTEEGFGSGTLNLVRLTSIDQLSCP